MVSRICHLLGNLLAVQMNDVLDAIFNQIMQVSDPTVRNNLCRAFCTLLVLLLFQVYLASNIADHSLRQNQYVRVFGPVIDFLRRQDVISSYSDPATFHQSYNNK